MNCVPNFISIIISLIKMAEISKKKKIKMRYTNKKGENTFFFFGGGGGLFSITLSINKQRT